MCCEKEARIEDFSADGDEEVLNDIQQIGLCDAHCHPTTYHLEELRNIGSMATNLMVCMSTSLKDMEDVSKLAETYPDQVVPAYGLHPWFSHHFHTGQTPPVDKATHYKRVLLPEPSDDFIDQLPDPISVDELTREMGRRLELDERAIVGECGLDKTFRIPDTSLKKLSKYTVNMDHQVEILRAQLEVGVQYQRHVSVHGVKCPQILFDTIKQFGKRLSSICLHSYSGNAQFLEQNWYIRKTQMDRPDLPIVYVSVSHMINNSNRSTAIEDLIEVVPPDRLLLESDYFCAGNTMDQLNLRILRATAEVSRETPADMAEMVKRNLSSFLRPRVQV